jgi:ABC-type protease/lipase transport system fused ATPase/permease subunit
VGFTFSRAFSSSLQAAVVAATITTVSTATAGALLAATILLGHNQLPFSFVKDQTRSSTFYLYTVGEL